MSNKTLTPREWWESIGSPKYILAPMVNGSDLPFRFLCLKYGCDLAFSPMLNAGQIAKSDKYVEKNLPVLRRFREYYEKTVIAQVSGSDPDTVVQACKKLEPYVDAIDLNCGCPQKIAKTGHYGAYLLKDIDNLCSIVSAMVNNLKCRVTVKLRVIEDDQDDFVKEACGDEFALKGKLSDDFIKTAFSKTIKLIKRLETIGVSAITLHSRSPNNKGHSTFCANWDLCKYIRKVISIPFICNGSISSLTDANLCLDHTGADAVMSGVGLLCYPALFHKGSLINHIDLSIELCIIYIDTELGSASDLKAHLYKMLHAQLQNADILETINNTNTKEQLLEFCKHLKNRVEHSSRTSENAEVFDAVSYYFRKYKTSNNE